MNLVKQRGEKMSSYEIDLDEVMFGCCEKCGHVITKRGARGSFGEPLDPDWEECPAGELGDGELVFDGCDTFYCKEAGDYDGYLEDKAEGKLDSKRGL